MPALKRRPASSAVSLELDADQLDVVSSERPTLVLGGPGTGKTTVAIEYALARIRQGLDPQHLLVFGYGRERAAYLRDEIAIRGQGITREPLARTFHSFCYGVLRRHALISGHGEPVLLSGPEQDATIRELLHGDAVEGFTHWPASLHAALTKSAFARELRDLISRATERNLSPKELHALGEEMGREDWQAASRFYQRYREISALHDTYALDPSAIIVETIALLDEHPEMLDQLRNEHRLILVDEFQESDPSQRELLRMLIADRPFLLTADPDSSVLRFRGAAPESVLQAAESLSSNLQVKVLSTNYRSTSAITNLGTHVAASFRGSGPQRSRTAAVQDDGSIDVVTLHSVTAEARFAALTLREAHLRHGIPWSEMAIVLRSPSGRLAELQRACAQAEVPIIVDADALALADQPAVLPLLVMARAALDARSLKPELVEALLMSPYGGADALSLKAIRQQFRSPESDLSSTSTALLDALLGKDAMADLDQRVIAPVRRIGELIQHARRANKKGAQAEDLLWAIWSHATDARGKPIAQSWQAQALAGGAAGARADRDLDAVVALFEMAARFADRKVGATPETFFAELLQQEIPGDTIAAKAQRSDVVEIMTVHSAKGREWQLVVVLGVQEGQWPNLKLRGSLLGSEVLVAAVETGVHRVDEVLKGAALALLDDERRLFHVAVTRAKSRLVICAVSDDVHQPSIFFADAEEFPQSQRRDLNRLPRQLTMSALVAQLRQELSHENAEDAARVLAHLRSNGVTSADPSMWWTASTPSTTQPIRDPEHVVVTPSTVELFETCQLRWFLERHGGVPGESSAQAIGSAVHELAEKLANGANLTELETEFNRIWPNLDQFGGWCGARERNRVLRIIERLVEWNSANPRTVIAAEAGFDGKVAGVNLQGKIDRVERSADGEVVVVDLKTSQYPISVDEAAENPQLALYQLAIQQGLLDETVQPRPDRVTAELVYPASSTKEVSVRRQGSVDVDQIAERLVSVAAGLASSGFRAVYNKNCSSCSARTSCPLMSRSVIS